MSAAPMRPSLNSLRDFLLSNKPSSNGRTHVIIGNEAADIDSLACAITLAYARRGQSKLTQMPVVPVANLPRADLQLRRDALLALSLAGLSPSDLVFADELPGGLANTVSAGSVILVDHNALAHHQDGAASRVVGLIDHHKDERKYLSASPRIIEKVGSCATLVANMLEPGDDRGAARLLLCAVMLDTNLLRSEEKTTVQDIKAMAQLAAIAEWDEKKCHDVYKLLKNARSDVSGFDARDILRRDLKTFLNGGLCVAIASIGLSPEELVGLAQENELSFYFDEFARQKEVDCVFGLMNHSTKGFHERHLCVLAGQVGDAIQEELYAGGKGEIGLERCQVKGGGGLWWFQLKDAGLSRKIVAPVVTQALGVVAKALR